MLDANCAALRNRKDIIWNSYWYSYCYIYWLGKHQYSLNANQKSKTQNDKPSVSISRVCWRNVCSSCYRKWNAGCKSMNLLKEAMLCSNILQKSSLDFIKIQTAVIKCMIFSSIRRVSQHQKESVKWWWNS